MGLIGKQDIESILETGHERIIVRNYKELSYTYIDYHGLSDDQMIEVLQALIDLTKKNPLPFIARFDNDNKIRPDFLKKGNEWIQVTKKLVPYGAFLGLDAYKATLLESIVKINGLKHRHFKELREAEDSLVRFYKYIG